MNKDTLSRFLEAQNEAYYVALGEIRAGKKSSHWMWYIFPQLREPGRSETALFYGISGLDEAKAYLAHEVLGSRLKEISEALLRLPTNNPTAVMGTPDDLKLQSSMTLFAEAARAEGMKNEDSVFMNVLKKFYAGKKDENTLNILKNR